MNRRKFLAAAATASAALVGMNSTRALLAGDSTTHEVKGVPTKNYKLTPPVKGAIPVAIVISEGVNIIDFSGPWGAFDSVMLKNDKGEMDGPFDVFSVSERTEIVTAGGLKLMPGYSFADCPSPKIVVVPAQMGSDAMIQWLRKVAVTADVTISVCTGAFKLAKAGLLSGMAATTHHEYLDKLQEQYPDIKVQRGVRFVEGEKISTAGGLTSGTDLALRVVERYYGREVAQAAATYMEYQGKGWMV